MSKYLVIILVCCFYDLGHAENAFEIPRSTVVEIKDTASGRTYPIFIKLPRSYEEDKKHLYPVVYMTDAYFSFQITSGAIFLPNNNGVMEEMILVGISYAQGENGRQSRIRDYTPIKAKDWKFETGGSEAHANFIRAGVFPYVERQYRASPRNRTLMGHSLGGLFAAHILLTQPDMFSNYVIGSPSAWFEEEYILSLKAKPSDQPKRVYISVGALETAEQGLLNDMVASAKALSEKLKQIKQQQLEVRLSVVEGATHSTVFPTIAAQGLDWIYGKK